VKNRRKIEAPRLPVVDTWFRLEEIGAADKVVETRDTHRRHQFANFLGDEKEIIDDVLGLAAKPLALFRVLRGHADGTGIEMAFAHHDAALDHQRRGCEPKLVGAEQGAD
jgi:hypothetical protein